MRIFNFQWKFSIPKIRKNYLWLRVLILASKFQKSAKSSQKISCTEIIVSGLYLDIVFGFIYGDRNFALSCSVYLRVNICCNLIILSSKISLCLVFHFISISTFRSTSKCCWVVTRCWCTKWNVAFCIKIKVSVKWIRFWHESSLVW